MKKALARFLARLRMWGQRSDIKNGRIVLAFSILLSFCAVAAWELQETSDETTKAVEETERNSKSVYDVLVAAREIVVDLGQGDYENCLRVVENQESAVAYQNRLLDEAVKLGANVDDLRKELEVLYVIPTCTPPAIPDTLPPYEGEEDGT